MNPILLIVGKETGELLLGLRGLAWLLATTIVLSGFALLLVGDTELSLLRPKVVLLVGQMAMTRFLGPGRLEERVGRTFGERPVLVPLPHPSGQSRWLNDQSNRDRLSHALAHVAELRSRFIARDSR